MCSIDVERELLKFGVVEKTKDYVLVFISEMTKLQATTENWIVNNNESRPTRDGKSHTSDIQ